MTTLASRASDVRINEVNFSQTISQAADAVAAQVVVSASGPLGPVFYSNPTDYLAAYGNPNAAVSFDHYAAIDYFKEGSAFWANRVAEADARYSASVLYVDSLGVTSIAPIAGGLSAVNLNLPNWNLYVPSGATPIYIFYSKNGPGSFANSIAYSVTSQNLPAPKALVATSTGSGGSIGAGTYTYWVSATSAQGNETLASSPATIVISAATSLNSVNLTWSSVAGATSYRIYGRSSTASSSGLLATIGVSSTSFKDDGFYLPSATQFPITSNAGITNAAGFQINIYDTTLSVGSPVETFNCTMNETVDVSGLQTETTQRINPFSQYVRVLSYVSNIANSLPILGSVNSLNYLAGGSSGSTPTDATINAGWAVFSNKSQYTIDVLINSGRADPVVQLAMDSVAQGRADCVAFCDTPSTQQTFNAAIDYRNVNLNLNSSYSALFCPDLLESDPINGKLLYIPPSGAMAGLFARTSRLANPWYSMAGLNRGLLNVLDVRYTYDDGQSTALYEAQVNYMRKFLGAGIPLWEQSTLSSQSSALQFLNVRTLCNVIKRSAYRYLIYGLQEPLDDILTMQLTTGLAQYLDTVKSKRGIKKFEIISDSTVNPPALTNSGILKIAVIIVPILAVREIQLTLGISKQGLTVTESLIQSL